MEVFKLQPGNLGGHASAHPAFTVTAGVYRLQRGGGAVMFAYHAHTQPTTSTSAASVDRYGSTDATMQASSKTARFMRPPACQIRRSAPIAATNIHESAYLYQHRQGMARP